MARGTSLSNREENPKQPLLFRRGSSPPRPSFDVYRSLRPLDPILARFGVSVSESGKKKGDLERIFSSMDSGALPRAARRPPQKDALEPEIEGGVDERAEKKLREAEEDGKGEENPVGEILREG